MKIFTVVASGGEYDGAWDTTVGAYSTKELAESAIQKIKATRKQMAEKYPELKKEYDSWSCHKARPEGTWVVLKNHEQATEVWWFDIEEIELDSDITYGL